MPPQNEEVSWDIKLEYWERYKAMDGSAAANASLARWCELYGLDEYAETHWRQTLALAPGNAEAERALRDIARRRSEALQRDEAGAQGAPDAAPLEPSQSAQTGRENLPWSEPDETPEEDGGAPADGTPSPPGDPTRQPDSVDTTSEYPRLLWCVVALVAILGWWALRKRFARRAQERKRYVPQELKHQVFRKYKGRCVRCGSPENLEYDHIRPFSKGGETSLRNLQLLCSRCNRKKKDK